MAMAELFEALDFYSGKPKPRLAEHLKLEYSRMLTYVDGQVTLQRQGKAGKV